MVSYLTRVLGPSRLDLAEDVVQDTLCRAMETWSLQGLPENPSAWLMRTARNRAIDLLRRGDRFQDLAPQLLYLLRRPEEPVEYSPAFDREIQDDQLRMMFLCCHPVLTSEIQVTLILKTLCGFSVSEISQALLTREDSIEKRLSRARKSFRAAGRYDGNLAASEIPQRLDAVYQAIYLLFNEGYHGSRSERTVREELCFEAIRLALLLSRHPDGDKPSTHALLALLCFHAARLAGRTDDDGSLLQLESQDRSRWDQSLIGQGFRCLETSSSGSDLSGYHLEAAIAAVHCLAPSYRMTDWVRILELYDLLVRIKPSPIVALNRAIAAGQAHGPEYGLRELRTLPDAERLRSYPFYPAALGEFCLLAGRTQQAVHYFENALKLARSQSEESFFKCKLRSCRSVAGRG